MSNHTKQSKCKGRFPEARTLLGEAAELIKINENQISIDSIDDLLSVLSLAGENDMLYDVDVIDPYFNGRTDKLRADPVMADYDKNFGHALIPLLARELSEKGMYIADNLLDDYPRIFGTLENTVNGLRLFHKNRKDLSKQLGIDLAKIAFPVKGDFSGATTTISDYHLEGHFGIGGTGNAPVVSDCPYLIHLVSNENKGAEEPEKVSLGIGFWYNPDNTLLVAQIQNAHNAKLPENIHMGVLGLHIATHVARKLGSKAIRTYSARNHPYFIQYPHAKQKLEGEFKCYFDNSARALGWSGTHGEYYELNLGCSSKSKENPLEKVYTPDHCMGCAK